MLLGLIGGMGPLPFLGSRPWADGNDENQVCKSLDSSGSCPSEVGGLGPIDMVRIRHASS